MSDAPAPSDPSIPSDPPDHLLEVLEDDESVPPRPEEAVADAAREPQTP